VLAKDLTNHVTYESPPLYSKSRLVIHDLHISQYEKESLTIEYIYIYKRLKYLINDIKKDVRI
jgi:hypothetical protein